MSQYTVHCPIRHGFNQVFVQYVLLLIHVCQCASYFQDFMMCARRHSQLFNGKLNEFMIIFTQLQNSLAFQRWSYAHWPYLDALFEYCDIAELDNALVHSTHHKFHMLPTGLSPSVRPQFEYQFYLKWP